MTMGDVMADVDVDVGYLSAGGNRQTAAGDWNFDGTVAFGADTNIALWRPNVRHHCTLTMLTRTRTTADMAMVGPDAKGHPQTTEWAQRHCQGSQVLASQARRCYSPSAKWKR